MSELSPTKKYPRLQNRILFAITALLALIVSAFFLIDLYNGKTGIIDNFARIEVIAICILIFSLILISSILLNTIDTTSNIKEILISQIELIAVQRSLFMIAGLTFFAFALRQSVLFSTEILKGAEDEIIGFFIIRVLAKISIISLLLIGAGICVREFRELLSRQLNARYALIKLSLQDLNTKSQAIDSNYLEFLKEEHKKESDFDIMDKHFSIFKDHLGGIISTVNKKD